MSPFCKLGDKEWRRLKKSLWRRCCSPSWCPRPRVANKPKWRWGFFVGASRVLLIYSCGPAGGSHWPRCFSSDSDDVISRLTLSFFFFLLLTIQQAKKAKLPHLQDVFFHEMKTSPESNLSCSLKVRFRILSVKRKCLFSYCILLLFSRRIFGWMRCPGPFLRVRYCCGNLYRAFTAAVNSLW